MFGKFIRYLCKVLLESKVLLSSNFFHTNLLSFLEIQTLIKAHSFIMPGASNLAILIFSIYLFHFWHSQSAPNPKNVFRLNESTCYSKHLGEKNFGFGSILDFLRPFKVALEGFHDRVKF